MIKLTQAQLESGYTKISLPVKTFMQLPHATKEEVKNLLFGYIDRGNDSNFVYIIPVYLAQELEKIAKRI